MSRRHHSSAARMWTRGRAFIRAPRGTLLLILAVLFTAASTRESSPSLAPALASALATAALIDVPVLRWRGGRWRFPGGGLITALLVTMVVSPYDPWHVAPLATAVGLASKHLLRWRGVNVLNPAAIGLVASTCLANAAHSWWGALPELPPLVGWPLLLASGSLMVDRVRRTPLVLAFLATYFLLFTTAAYVGDPAAVAELFIAPDLQAAVFFAVFMLSDPPTSPTLPHRQVQCGAIVGVVSFALFVTTGAASYLLGGLISGNLFTWATASHRHKSAGAARIRIRRAAV